MERRHFLKLALGLAAGAAVAVKTGGVVQAAPLLPATPLDNRPPDHAPQPAVTLQDDVDRLRPEQVRWHRGWRRRRYWGWRRRRVWRRPWGWHRRRFYRRRHWRRRYW